VSRRDEIRRRIEEVESGAAVKTIPRQRSSGVFEP